ncbi:unnamed protein product [Mytilus coruscus]|uniref:Reverse transcriptase domain-containing protein n=1 Tax=Mytilus coruscus TaxID=42192 RepID=A0A6J8D6L5_MYTCO|nr:unnamed protein product [Mytilus coruscus]
MSPNTSSHVPVSAKMNVKSKPTNKAIKSAYISKFKIQWKDIDIYVNNLVEDLKSHNLGLKIGTNYVGCPTCADDIAFLSSSHQELQCMLSVATYHARQSRVTINPTKTKAVILNKPKNINRSDLNWTLGNTPVYPSEDTTHLGLIRAELKENNLNVDL